MCVGFAVNESVCLIVCVFRVFGLCVLCMCFAVCLNMHIYCMFRLCGFVCLCVFLFLICFSLLCCCLIVCVLM